MFPQRHRGSLPGGLGEPAVDRRVLELDDALRGVEAVTGALPALGLARDPGRAAAAVHHALGRPGRMARGVVVHPLPGLNWYKVQLGEGGGTVACCAAAGGSLMPPGPKDLAMPGPNDNVLVFRPANLNFGIIVGTLPAAVSAGSVSCPDWIVQGGGTGLRREPGYVFPLAGMYKGGGAIDWSAQRPPDQTPLERGWITSTGVALTVDDDLLQARVNEMTGVWMTGFDNWLRVAGGQLLVESLAHEEDAGEDEGETRYFRGVAAYPHEALGLYAPATFTSEISDDEVQTTADKGKVDLPDGAEDQRHVYRYQEYGGYLGQGHLRLVMAPTQAAGRSRFRADGPPDAGLFMESIGLDGGYTLLSAKDVHIGKRCQVLAPRAKTVPADKAGDDAERGGYMFSGLYGSGDPHRVGDVAVTGQVKALTRAAAVADLVAYAATWKAVHPFHYHAGDYQTPNPSELPTLTRNQESVNYSSAGRFYVADPSPLRLRIDHRYGQVEYFARESFIRFFDDGTVMLAGGAGETLLFAGGRAQLDAPMGVDVRPGGDFVVLADQIVLRAKGSVDVSSTEKDVRLKAEGNMQLLAGNKKKGGILIESKGEGTQQQYLNKYGEDVVSNGVVVKAAKSTAALFGKDVYLRTGGADLGEGDILIDAGRGTRRVQVFGKEFHTYTTKGVTFNYGPIQSTSTVTKVYYFGEKTCVMDAQLLLGGKLIGYGGGGGNPGVIVDGGVYGTKSFATAGVMADKKGMWLGKVPPGFASTISSAVAEVAAAVEELKTAGEVQHRTTIVEKYYQTDQLGDDALIELLTFGFRDPPGAPTQYKAQGFLWPEARWQQAARLGAAAGGVRWTEKPVVYQGRKTYPWPGQQKWAGEPTLLQLDELTMADPAAGRDRDRPGRYESPATAGATPVTPDGTYTLTR